MAIFSFIAKLGLDTTDFQSGVKRAQSAATGLGKGIANSLKHEASGIGSALAGMFTVGAAKSYFSDLKAMVDEIKDMSELLGVSTDEVQRLQKASAEAGQNFGSVVTAFQRIEQMRAQAMTGDDRAKGIFGLLGIDPSKGGGIEILKAAVLASEKGAHENAAAFELLGRKVTGLKLTVEELQRLGPIKLIEKDQLDTLDEGIKQYEEALRQFKIAGAPVATLAMQSLTGWANMFNPENRAQQEAINEAYRRGEHGILRDIELSAMSLLGIKDTEGMKYPALPFQDRRPAAPQDQTAILLDIARSNAGTFQILSEQVRQ